MRSRQATEESVAAAPSVEGVEEEQEGEGEGEEEDVDESGADDGAEDAGEEAGGDAEGEAESADAGHKPSREERMAKLKELRLRMVSCATAH